MIIKAAICYNVQYPSAGIDITCGYFFVAKGCFFLFCATMAINSFNSTLPRPQWRTRGGAFFKGSHIDDAQLAGGGVLAHKIINSAGLQL